MSSPTAPSVPLGSTASTPVTIDLDASLVFAAPPSTPAVNDFSLLRNTTSPTILAKHFASSSSSSPSSPDDDWNIPDDCIDGSRYDFNCSTPVPSSSTLFTLDTSILPPNHYSLASHRSLHHSSNDSNDIMFDLNTGGTLGDVDSLADETSNPSSAFAGVYSPPKRPNAYVLPRDRTEEDYDPIPKLNNTRGQKRTNADQTATATSTTLPASCGDDFESLLDLTLSPTKRRSTTATHDDSPFTAAAWTISAAATTSTNTGYAHSEDGVSNLLHLSVFCVELCAAFGVGIPSSVNDATTSLNAHDESWQKRTDYAAVIHWESAVSTILPPPARHFLFAHSSAPSVALTEIYKAINMLSGYCCMAMTDLIQSLQGVAVPSCESLNIPTQSYGVTPLLVQSMRPQEVDVVSQLASLISVAQFVLTLAIKYHPSSLSPATTTLASHELPGERYNSTLSAFHSTTTSIANIDSPRHIPTQEILSQTDSFTDGGLFGFVSVLRLQWALTLLSTTFEPVQTWSCAHFRSSQNDYQWLGICSAPYISALVCQKSGASISGFATFYKCDVVIRSVSDLRPPLATNPQDPAAPMPQSELTFCSPSQFEHVAHHIIDPVNLPNLPPAWSSVIYALQVVESSLGRQIPNFIPVLRSSVAFEIQRVCSSETTPAAFVIPTLSLLTRIAQVTCATNDERLIEELVRTFFTPAFIAAMFASNNRILASRFAAQVTNHAITFLSTNALVEHELRSGPAAPMVLHLFVNRHDPNISTVNTSMMPTLFMSLVLPAASSFFTSE